jgi:predicted transposase/invertase (TIGR01784 family)
MVFGDERNKHILKAFLLAVLDLPEEEYNVLEILNSSLRIHRPDETNEKLGVLDVHIRTKAGRHIDVEVQVARTPFFKERITGYAGKMLGVQLFAGNEYIEMKKVVTIVILDYNLIKDSDSFHNKYMLYDAETKSLFTDIPEIHTLEMRKFPKEDLEGMAGMDEKTRQQLLWLKFIRPEDEEEIKALASKMPELQETYSVLKKLSENEEVRLLYASREKAIYDEQARLYGARKEGEAIGESRGEARGVTIGQARGERKRAFETARNLLEMNLASIRLRELPGSRRKKFEICEILSLLGSGEDPEKIQFPCDPDEQTPRSEHWLAASLIAGCIIADNKTESKRSCSVRKP